MSKVDLDHKCKDHNRQATLGHYANQRLQMLVSSSSSYWCYKQLITTPLHYTSTLLHYYRPVCSAVTVVTLQPVTV